MTTIIKKNTKIAEARRLIIGVKIKPKKPFSPEQYSGVLKLQKDPLELQKEWRREWNYLLTKT
jgi:hypothetical protein